VPDVLQFHCFIQDHIMLSLTILMWGLQSRALWVQIWKQLAEVGTGFASKINNRDLLLANLQSA
jgi:hypothetical protein